MRNNLDLVLAMYNLSVYQWFVWNGCEYFFDPIGDLYYANKMNNGALEISSCYTLGEMLANYTAKDILPLNYFYNYEGGIVND